MTPNRQMLVATLSALACALSLGTTQGARAQESGPPSETKPAAHIDDRALGAALCPIVYQVDRAPSAHGYRYLFYGNAFFINKDGYLLTATHVLSQLHGVQPYVLLRARTGPPSFVQANVVALDRDHDIAILRATPNPFDANSAVSILQLAPGSPTHGSSVLAAAVRPIKPRNSYTLDPAIEERLPGEVTNFEFSQLEKGRADTELVLFSHTVQPGQSGGPVISLDSKGVVGLVEGDWLRSDVADAASTTEHPGAFVPVHYAIALLQQRGISWNAVSENSRVTQQTPDRPEGFSPPTPLSLVPAPYPVQSLFGGEVLLDVLVGRAGAVSNIKVVRGEQPFVEKTLAAVHTWTLSPARSAGQAVEAHIAVVFQFPQPYIPPRSSTVHRYDEGPSSTTSRAALPLTTVEPEYPSADSGEGSVILYETIDHQGNITSVQTVRSIEPLTAATLAAAHEWRFAPAESSGTPIDSAAVIVVTFRRPLVTSHSSQ